MKFFVLLLVLIASAIAVTPACAPASYCKGCSETVATTCTSCFNWMAGAIGPKAMISPATTCGTAVAAITNCQIYNSGNGQAAAKAGTCLLCKDGNVVVETQPTSILTAYVPTCPATAPSGCTKIANCKQTKCSKAFGATAYTTTCSLCDSGKGPSSATACAGTIMANCDLAYWSSSVQGCWHPKSGYAVVNGAASTVAYTTDKNCVMLGVVATQCVSCWDGYYWNTTSCKLFASLISGAAFSLLALFM